MPINKIVLTVQDKSHFLLAYPDAENEQSTDHMQSEIQRMLKWLSKTKEQIMFFMKHTCLSTR